MTSLPPPPSHPAPPPATFGQEGPVPLDQPLYGATFSQSLSRFFRKYADFSGRASASEFWWAYLGMGLIALVPYVVFFVAVLAAPTDPFTGEPEVSAIWLIPLLLFFAVSLGMAIPFLAVTVRRLHDTGRSGWYYLLSFVPFGSIAVLVFLCQTSTPQGFAFDRRNGHPSLVVNPVLRARFGYGSAPSPYAGPGYGAPAWTQDAPPTDGDAHWPQDSSR